MVLVTLGGSSWCLVESWNVNNVFCVVVSYRCGDDDEEFEDCFSF